MPPRGRRPGSSGSRERILDAARELFAERGFERTTMRGVAARAEVDPALIHHYFGTKDGLLASALVLPVDPMLVVGDLRGSPATAGPRLVARVLTVWDSDVRARERSLGLLRVAISHERAAAVLRDVLGATALTAVRQVVADDRAELRAGLVSSQLGECCWVAISSASPPCETPRSTTWWPRSDPWCSTTSPGRSEAAR